MSLGPGKRDMTRERILDVAEALFAEKGFDGVSVREITGAAGCNLSAVNYHFGNKQNLHLEVFRRRWLPRAQEMQEAFRRNLSGKKRVSTETIVEAMARAFLEGRMSDEERSRHALAMIREIARPTEAFEMLVEDVMKPLVNGLVGLLRASLSPGAEEDNLALDLLSVFSVVLYFNFSRPIVSRVTGREYDEKFKAQLVRHIVDFSLHGLEGRGKGKTK